MTVVVDASVTMSWLLMDGKPTDRDYAFSVLASLTDPDAEALVPQVWGLEVANVIARAEASGLITAAQSEAFLEMLAALDVTVDDTTHSRALTDILALARRYALSTYDAAYLELALRSGLPLATLDADLARAGKKAGITRFSASSSS